MKKSEKNAILIEAAEWNDQKLERETYNASFETLGSTAQLMEEAGWELEDIKEQRALEKYQAERADLLQYLCEKRGIKLWN